MRARSPYVDIYDWDPIRFSVQIADVTDDGLLAYFEDVEARLQQDYAIRNRFVIVFDPRHGRPPTLEQRLVQARFIERVGPLVSEVNLGTVVCTPSAILRGMMAALFWVARPSSPQASISTMRASLAWAVEKVTLAGMTIPDAIRDDPEGVLAEVEARGIAARF